MAISTRIDLINYMTDGLGILATEAGWTSTSYYEKPLDLALLATTGDTVYPPASTVSYTVPGIMAVFEQACLRKLRNYYSFYVDTEVGPRKQKFSQLLKSIEARILETPISVDNTTEFKELDPQNTTYNIDGFELLEYDYYRD